MRPSFFASIFDSRHKLRRLSISVFTFQRRFSNYEKSVGKILKSVQSIKNVTRRGRGSGCGSHIVVIAAAATSIVVAIE